MTPRLIGISDQSLLVNAILVALRSRLLAPADPTEEAVMRLNLAAALARVEAWSDAKTELQNVKLAGRLRRRQRHRAVPARAVRRPSGEPV